MEDVAKDTQARGAEVAPSLGEGSQQSEEYVHRWNSTEPIHVKVIFVDFVSARAQSEYVEAREWQTAEAFVSKLVQGARYETLKAAGRITLCNERGTNLAPHQTLEEADIGDRSSVALLTHCDADAEVERRYNFLNTELVERDTVWEERRQKLQDFLEEPSSSWGAQLFSVFMLLVILSSTASLLVESLSDIKNDESAKDDIAVFEACCIVVFTAEFLARLIVCETKCAFMKAPMNVVDLVAIFPFYLEQVLTAAGASEASGESSPTGTTRVLRLLRLIRIFRVIKLAKISRSMKLAALS